jgi:hypothetical protein
MRTGLVLMAIGAVCWANLTFGTRKMDAARSTFTGAIQPKSLTVRIEPHAKGAVFTLDRIEADGDPIVAQIGPPDSGDPTQVRTRSVDEVRPPNLG